PIRLATAVRVRCLVRTRWRGADGADPARAGDDGAVRGLSRLCLRGDPDLAFPADRPPAAARRRAVDVSDQQDRPRRAAVRAFSGAGGGHGAAVAARLAGSDLAMAAAAGAVRPAFAGDLLPWRVP